MKRALVTGASGFVGAHLVRELIKRGYMVHAMLRDGTPRWRLDDVKEKIIIHSADLTNKESVARAVSESAPNEIFHLATAGVYGGKSLPDQETIEVNLTGFLNLVGAADSVSYDAFINTGSSSEYGIAREPMRENMNAMPENVYGITKLAATQYARLVARTHSRPIVTLRLFSPYGPFDDGRRFIMYVLTKMLRGEDVIVSRPEVARDYIYIDDVMRAYFDAAENALQWKGEVFNIGSGKEVSIGKVLELLAHITHSPSRVTWTHATGRPWESLRWEADISKVAEKLGWKPRVTLEDGLGRTVEWLKQNMTRYLLS